MPSVSPSPDRHLHYSPAKRKRSTSDSTSAPFAPRLRTDIVEASSYSDELGSESPRTIVADRLSDLRLQGSASGADIEVRGASVDVEDEPDLRRPKMTRLMEEMIDDSDVGQGSDGDSEPKSQQRSSAQPKSAAMHRRLATPPPGGSAGLEIPETPPKAGPVLSPPKHKLPPSPLRSPEGPTKTIAVVAIPMARSTSIPTKKATSVSHDQNGEEDIIHVLSQAPKKPPKRSVESTNHEASELLLDPDDDGTGINGIGFRPTPAIAWARTQKRKQQVQEWRARENKEARQKRRDRRGQPGSVVPSADAVMHGASVIRRTVRFE